MFVVLQRRNVYWMRRWLGQTFDSSTLPQLATDPLIGVRANTKKQQYVSSACKSKTKKKKISRKPKTSQIQCTFQCCTSVARSCPYFLLEGIYNGSDNITGLPNFVMYSDLCRDMANVALSSYADVTNGIVTIIGTTRS
jgi:hypothetical protein